MSYDSDYFETSGVDESEYCFEHSAILDECEECEQQESGNE